MEPFLFMLFVNNLSGDLVASYADDILFVTKREHKGRGREVLRGTGGIHSWTIAVYIVYK